MKKYISSILIPCLLLQFSGCYNMQLITKEEFLKDSDYSELRVKTKENKFTFKSGNYTFNNDTIYGRGEVKSLISLVNTYEPFDGGIGLSEVKIIRTEEFDITIVNRSFIVKTDKKQFVFDEGTYFIEVDTVYGKGQCISRIISGKSFEPFEGGISLNDIEEIQTDDFNFISTHFDLIVVLEENEIIFEANNYVVNYDSIAGNGKINSMIETKKDNEPFSGSIDINDVEEIQVYKFNFTSVAALGIFLVFAFSIFILGAKKAAEGIL